MDDIELNIKKAEELINTLKQAFQPMPGGGPTAMQGGAPPMDPAMMQQGGAPPQAPPADPAQMEAMLSELMSAVEQIAQAVEQSGQQVAQLQSQLQQVTQEHMMMGSKLEMLEKALNTPSPMEGVPSNMM